MEIEKILEYRYYKLRYSNEEFLFKLRGIANKIVNAKEPKETPSMEYFRNKMDEIYDSMSDEEKLYIELED